MPDDPIVYYPRADHPENQYYFWKSYEDRKGQDAIFVRRLKRNANPEAAPKRIADQFDATTDLGVFDVHYRGAVMHRVHLVVCHRLR